MSALRAATEIPMSRAINTKMLAITLAAEVRFALVAAIKPRVAISSTTAIATT